MFPNFSSLIRGHHLPTNRSSGYCKNVKAKDKFHVGVAIDIWSNVSQFYTNMYAVVPKILCIKIGSFSRFSVPRCFSSISPKHTGASAKSSRSCQCKFCIVCFNVIDWSALLVAPALW
jgi:hypothetical protein